MMRRTINLLLMLLFVAEVTSANTVDFDKAFKESARIEKQIKRTSFPKRTFLITDFGAKTDDEANPCHEAINQAILQIFRQILTVRLHLQFFWRNILSQNFPHACQCQRAVQMAVKFHFRHF